MNVDVWHNIMWSKYKAVVFSELYRLGLKSNAHFTFYQIAETEQDRISLSEPDYSYHNYPFKLLFRGSYEAVGIFRRSYRCGIEAAQSTADLVVLAGFSQPEYWIQAIILFLKRKKFAFFCDSTSYDNVNTRWKSAAKRLFFHMSAGAFCYGERSSEYLQRHGMDTSRIVKRCQAAALPPSYDKSMVAQERLRHRQANPNFTITYIGRLSEEKRVDDLIEAFTQLLRIRTDAELRIVGSGPDMGRLLSLVTDANVRAKVHFIGSLSGDDLYRQYLSASCIVLPSYREPWGLVINESLSYGCPVIVSDRCGCIPELVIQHTSGLTFECGNIKQLTACLVRVQTEFPDTETTVLRLTTAISEYTPENAALNILRGCAHFLRPV